MVSCVFFTQCKGVDMVTVGGVCFDSVDSAVESLRSSGFSIREIAKALGIPKSRVHKMVTPPPGLLVNIRKASKVGGKPKVFVVSYRDEATGDIHIVDVFTFAKAARYFVDRMNEFTDGKEWFMSSVPLNDIAMGDV